MAGYDDKAARRQLEEILASNQKKTRALAKGIADSVLARTQSSSDPINQILTDVFRAQDVSGRMRKIVGPAVVQSVAAGYGVLPSVGYQPSAPVVDKALSMRWDPRSMPNLSAQVHGTAQAYRQDLEDSLRTSFAQAKTVQQAARAIYDGYQPGLRATGPFAAITPAIPARGGNAPAPHLPQVIQDGVNAASILSPGDKVRFKKYADAIIGHAEQMKLGPLRASYMELAQTLEKTGQRGLERAIRVATEEKARYHADRIARTESARAWDAGFRARIDEDPRVVGIKSRTSSAHKVFDICDFHARADMYGMGEGCYPKDRAPEYPYHPHCTCNRSPIYRRRPSSPPPRAGGPDVDAGTKTLQGMTDQERRALLSAHGAKAFGTDPGSWTRSMRNLAQPGGADPAIAAAKVVIQALPSVPKTFTPVKSIEEAERFARDSNLADLVSYKGLHLEAANEINRTLSDHLDMFPAIRKGLQFVGSAQERDLLARKARLADGWPLAKVNQHIKPVGRDNLASSSDSRHIQYKGFQGIAFNQKTFGDQFDHWTKEWKASQSGIGKYHPPGKSYTVDVTAHELGHQIDALLDVRIDPEVAALWREASRGDLLQTVSGYANRGGITEGIAEGWAEAYGAQAPRSFALGLRERILKIAGGSP